MASTRFTVLTGHLSQHSLADLIGILRHQRKTGRLIIEYIGSPAVLFFKDGDLVDAQYNTLIGVQAIFVAFVQPAASFNFNPLMQPTRYSIDSEQQRVILELLGCWTEDMIVVKSSSTRPEVAPEGERQPPELHGTESQLLIEATPVDKPVALNKADEVLALPAGPPERSTRRYSNRRPWILAIATFVLLLVFGVPTLIAINNKVRKPTVAPATPAPVEVIAESEPTAADAANSLQVSTKPVTTTSSNPSERKQEGEQLSGEQRSDAGLKDAGTTSAPPKEATQSATNTDQTVQPEKKQQTAASGQTVKVIMRIENGRVVQATIGDRRPGSEGYESLALRIARQRRYPAGVNKQETLIMKVDGPK